MILPSKKRVYVAGAYNAPDIITALYNMKIGIDLSVRLLHLGFAPFCPWLDYQFYLVSKEPISMERILDYSIEYLRACGSMIVADNNRNMESKGLQKELLVSKNAGIPIFWEARSGVDLLVNWAAMDPGAGEAV